MERGGVFLYSLTRYLEGVGESVVLPVYVCALYLFSLRGPGEGDLVSSPRASHTGRCPRGESAQCHCMLDGRRVSKGRNELTHFVIRSFFVKSVYS